MKISIIITTLDNIEYMKIAIPAYRKHTVNPYEILVHVNKCSSKMKEYGSKENFDVFDYTDGDDGIAKAVNSLIKQATGDVIFYVADDVYVTPNWDVALIRKLNYNIFYQFLTVPQFQPLPKVINPRNRSNLTTNAPFNFGRTPETWQEQEFLSKWWDLRQIKEDIIKGLAPVFGRKELWDKIGGFDEEYWPGFGTDPDLAAKVYFAAKKEGKPYEFRGVADCGMYHFTNITTSKIPNAGFYRKQAHKRFFKKWGITYTQFTNLIDIGRKL